MGHEAAMPVSTMNKGDAEFLIQSVNMLSTSTIVLLRSGVCQVILTFSRIKVSYHALVSISLLVTLTISTVVFKARVSGDPGILMLVFVLY